jgi:hypothetical protein
MKMVPHGVFGHLVFLYTADAGDTAIVQRPTVESFNDGFMYFYSGKMVYEPNTVSWLATEQLPGDLVGNGGTNDITVTYTEASEWLCVPKKANTTIAMAANPIAVNMTLNETRLLSNNTNLYLVKGVLSINGKNFTGPYQIRVRSGDVTATATSAVSAINFA